MSDVNFLINLDHCIPESAYDFFLYKSRSEEKLLYFPKSSLGDNGIWGSTDANDIKEYLRRFALRIGFFQIIFAMHGDYPTSDEWENTLLCKILDINRVLIQSGILDSNGNSFNCLLSIFMIRRTKIVTGSKINDTKYAEKRMLSDCKLLCDLLDLPVDQRITVTELENAWTKYKKEKKQRSSYEGALSFFVDSTISSVQKKTELFRIVDVVNRLVSKYEINEIFVDEQSKQKLVEGVFKIIEYSTTPLKQKVSTPTSYRQKCGEHWQKINSNNSVLNDYAHMLYDFDDRLKKFIQFEENTINNDGNAVRLDKYVDVSENAISNSGAWFDNVSAGDGDSPNSVIERFKKNLSPIDALTNNWQETYGKLYKYADNLQAQLNKHAETLSNNYIEKLNERSRKMREIRLKGPYRVDLQTEKEINELIEKRQKVLEDMKQNQITPILHYKEQTKIETKLSVANNEITHYIDCLKAVKDVRIAVILISVMLSVTVLCYALLQYKVFSPLTAAYPAAYLFITLLCMAFLSAAPVFYYKHLIIKSLNKLKTEINSVAKKYEQKAKGIQKNLNQCNILDDLTRHIHIREYYIQASNNRKNARKWYIDRAIEHKEKLKAFSDLYRDDFVVHENNALQYPEISDTGDVDDVVDCVLFWPNA